MKIKYIVAIFKNYLNLSNFAMYGVGWPFFTVKLFTINCIHEHHSKVIRISPVFTDWPSQTLISLIRPFA